MHELNIRLMLLCWKVAIKDARKWLISGKRTISREMHLLVLEEKNVIWDEQLIIALEVTLLRFWYVVEVESQ